MNINNAFPSKYIKSGDIPDGTDLVLTIESVSIETVGQDDKAEDRPIVYFTEHDKGLVLNKTNANTITNLYGPETDGWLGKKIAIYATEVEFGGKVTLGIRVRVKPPKSNGTAPAVQPSPAPPDVLSKEQALELLASFDIPTDKLRARLPKDENGKALYLPARDTALVRQLVSEVIKQNDEPF